MPSIDLGPHFRIYDPEPGPAAAGSADLRLLRRLAGAALLWVTFCGILLLLAILP